MLFSDAQSSPDHERLLSVSGMPGRRPMKKRGRKMRRWLLGISPGAVNFCRRGFCGATVTRRALLERAAATFLDGYHLALEHDAAEDLERELRLVAEERRGFAYEGAGMGLALLDALTPWGGSRFVRFLQGAGDPHAYMVHVGVGWVWARLPFGRERLRRRLDPLLQWLAFDGWGFHEGYFHWRRYAGGRRPPARLDGYAARAFNQGLGRSWWFVNGGNPALIAQTIARFPAPTRADMWSGIGLAATYAGELNGEELAELRGRAGVHEVCLAQGSAFAAKARERAGNLTAYTDRAAQALCGLSALGAARLCDAMVENLLSSGEEPAYEIWRLRIQRELASKMRLREIRS
jgi:hypothetical protein